MADAAATRQARRRWRSTGARLRVSGWRADGFPSPSVDLAAGLEGLFDEVEPDIVISVGLWPGEPMMRFERIGINVADFEIPDNEGTCVPTSL